MTIKNLVKKTLYFLYPLNTDYSSREFFKKAEILLVSLDDPKGGEAVGGKHVHLYLLQKGLRKQENKVETLVPEISKRNFRVELARQIRTSNIFAYQNPFEVMLTVLRSSLTAKSISYLRNVGIPKIINAHDVIALVAVHEAWKQLEDEISSNEKRPIFILTLHGYFTRENIDYGNINPSEIDFIQKCIKIEEHAVNIADGIITVDERIRDYVKEEFKYEKPIEVITNAIDTDTFSLINSESSKSIRKSMNLNPDVPIILVPRRLVKKNGVTQAAIAAELMAQRDIDFLMLFVGDGPERFAVEEISKRIPTKIILTGAVPHSKVVDYFNIADIVLIPSIPSNGVEEATSLAAAEGLSVGKPVIAGDVGGLKKVIDSGINGYHCNCLEPIEIAEKIILLLNDKDLSQKFGIAGRIKADKEFGYLNHAEHFFKFFQEVQAITGK